MKILLTNDDGIYSKGIGELHSRLSEIAEVVVVAPITEQSAVGHAITLTSPLRIDEVYRKNTHFGYGVHGTPADCVKIAFDHILTSKPDLVVSGINHGANLASNVIYSGTVSAATEGAMLGVKSVAVSLASVKSTDFSVAAKFMHYFCQQIPEMDVPDNVLFNVNVPPIPEAEIAGWKFTEQGKTRFLDTFEKRVDPRGRTYFWLTGEKQHIQYFDESDDFAISEHYISVTPLQYNLTNTDLYHKLRETGVNQWK